MVVGALEVGVWYRSPEWASGNQYLIEIEPIRDLESVQLVGLEMHGPGMEFLGPAESIVFYSPADGEGQTPVSGDFVIVHRQRADGRVEATVKLMHIDEAGDRWLLAEPTRHSYWGDIRLDGSRDAGAVKVVGVVRAVWSATKPADFDWASRLSS